MTYSNTWLGCSGAWCARAACPQRFFSKSKSLCWGEVFTIYSRPAKGRNIKVGDKVALYYRRASRWFGCLEHRCAGKYACPGTPSWSYGFANAMKWTECWGEVFTIYAYGKTYGDDIIHRDPIMLQYRSRWVSLWEVLATKLDCPGTPPPGILKYDFCAGEAFEIFKL